MTKTLKWCIFIILLVSTKGGCFAQKLEVDSFGEAPYTELVPERDRIYDINRELCALIKVQIVDTSVQFEGGVSKFYPKGHNEWWVWISTEATHMKIKPSSCYPCEVIFGKYGFEHLEKASDKTYILRLVQSAINSDFSAKIIVYGKDGKPLEGAKLTNRETGKSERTNSDGVGTINFDKEGQTANITVSHFRYSDTKDVVVRVGDNLRITLFNYNPPTPPGNLKPPRVSFFKPELFTFYWDFSGSVNFDDTPLDISSITNFNTSLGVTFSYFQIGLGVGSISPPEQTTSSNLVNAGYTGNFTKTTTTKISNSPLNIFLDLGACFIWFSVSCQVGWLCNATIDRTSLYNGWGYGLVDEDVNEYWGNYEQRSFTNASSSKKSYFTLTPKVKLNLPRGESIGISLGLGYTIIPAMKYYVGLSGCLGIYFY